MLDRSLTDDKYIAVCGDPAARHGIVLAKNTLAKSMGVKTGEAIWQAKQKCPQLICVAPHSDAYAHFARAVRKIYSRYTDKIESFGIDECWLDVTGCEKIIDSGLQVANRIRNEVKTETGLTISIGVSWNKCFAKLGSDLKKPDAVTIIDKNNYKQMVWNLPVNEMVSIGRQTAAHLRRLNVFTLGDLANCDIELLRKHFGIAGPRMFELANGLDDSPVSINSDMREIKSVGHGTTTSHDIKSYMEAECVIFFLSEMVATRMRRYSVAGNTVSLDLRYCSLEHISRQMSLGGNTCVSSVIAASAIKLLKENWSEKTHLPLRTITVSVSSLEVAAGCVQDSIWSFNSSERNEMFEKSLDQIRLKHGYSCISRGNLIENSFLSDKYCEEDDLLPFRLN